MKHEYDRAQSERENSEDDVEDEILRVHGDQREQVGGEREHHAVEHAAAVDAAGD